MAEIDRTMGGRLHGLVAKAVEQFEQLMLHEAIHESCESEIEAMLGHAFFACDRLTPGFNPDGIEGDFKIGFNWHYPRGTTVEEMVARKDYLPCSIYVCPQVATFSYTVDFMCIMHDYDWIHDKSKKILLAVECDGHDFHERTKDQARRDRFRDRQLLLRGIPSMRFTGSEIWRDPYSCLRQIGEFFQAESQHFYLSNRDAQK
jgi:very-short-patch-repair endonuclease